MKLEEARKLATPGPLHVLRGTNGCQVGTDEHGCVFISKHHPPWDGPGKMDCQQRSRVTAALLAHAYNMLPELVGELERLHNRVSNEDRNRIFSILVKASEVPGV